MAVHIPIEIRLEKHVKLPWSGCWIWMGPVDKDGYGVIAGSTNSIKWTSRTHRESYKCFIGPIPEGKHVLHDCDTPGCVNPNHLHLGDCLMNNRERDARGRNNSGSLPGELCPMYGRTGPAHPMYGKKHTEEAKAKISAGLREYYKK